MNNTRGENLEKTERGDKKLYIYICIHVYYVRVYKICNA